MWVLATAAVRKNDLDVPAAAPPALSHGHLQFRLLCGTVMFPLKSLTNQCWLFLQGDASYLGALKA